MAINVTNLTNFVSSVGSSVSNAASSARSGVSGGSTNRDSYSLGSSPSSGTYSITGNSVSGRPLTNSEYNRIAAAVAGIYIDKNGNMGSCTYEQSMLFGQTVSNLHRVGLTTASTKEAIAAACVGTTVTINNKPIITSIDQGRAYGTAYSRVGVIAENISAGAGVKGNGVYINNEPKEKSLSAKLTGKYSEGLENYLLNLEKQYGTKYVFENVFKGDKSKYDPVKRASEITGIPVGNNGKPINCGAEGERYFDYILNGSNSKASGSQIRNDYIWNNTQGINLSEGNMDKITCQSTQYGGEYIGWVGCVSTTIAAMFRINDGAEGSASELVDSDPDGSNPSSGLQGYSFYTNGRTRNGEGINRNEALDLIKKELSEGKVCGVKLDKGTSNGHTVLCSGIREGVSLENATWEDLLFNDVGRGSTANREAKPYTEMNYPGVTYSVPTDGNCYVVVDTTK